MGVLTLFSTFVEKNYSYIAKERREGGIVRESVYTDTQTHTSTYKVMQTTHPLSRNNSGKLTFLLAIPLQLSPAHAAAVAGVACVCADNTLMWF